MKKTLFLILLCATSVVLRAQTVTSSNVKSELFQARLMMNKKSPKYNPKEAFNLLSKLSTDGSAEAMNGLGMLYSKGEAVTADEKKGFDLCLKAANAGYARAWYNVGTMYKIGVGTEQDFRKAFDCFEKGVSQNDDFCFYAKGYFLFEGLGCKQSYADAFRLFTISSAKNDLASMYMLGICYRNGYGTTRNIDSAKYWLTRSASRKYRFAVKELESPLPENTDNIVVQTIQPASAGVDVKHGYPKIKHHFPASDIEGEYTGYQLKFDWSGQHVIGQSALKLKLSQDKGHLSAEWNEDDTIATHIEATLTDTGLVFNNSGYSRNDHYTPKEPNRLQFRNAQLQLVKSADTVYVTGNIQLYSASQQEMEKPTFIMLMRTGNKNNPTGYASVSKIDSVHFVAYPNPFVNSLQLKYTLQKACYVSIMVSNVQTANVVYKSGTVYLEAGDHTSPLYLTGMPGPYAITLTYGNQLKSAIVIKQ
jgi:hypothetical protein